MIYLQVTESRSGILDTTELFECAVYLQEVSDILCICFAGMAYTCVIWNLIFKNCTYLFYRIHYGYILFCNTKKDLHMY